MDSLALHHLAKKSAETLTRFRALLGRLLILVARELESLPYLRMLANHLKISGSAPHGLRFLNLNGQVIRQQRTLDA